MLPEVLSNGVCSLQEGVDRFTMSAFIQFDERGEVQGQRFCRSMIRSCKRMTYLEAQALIEGDPDEATKHARTATPVTSELLETIRMADRLAKTLRKRRQRDGMRSLRSPLQWPEHQKRVEQGIATGPRMAPNLTSVMPSGTRDEPSS